MFHNLLGFWWLVMMFHNVWWFWWLMMMFHNLWWFLMFFFQNIMMFDDVWWFFIIYDGFWWFMMFDDVWWFMMINELIVWVCMSNSICHTLWISHWYGYLGWLRLTRNDPKILLQLERWQTQVLQWWFNRYPLVN